jgi:eukaryotic-like serine/threonine-protein kinase
MMPSDESAARTATSSDLIGMIRDSSILSDRQLEKLDRHLSIGELPDEPTELAARLVKEKILTPYQAHHLVRGRSQGLVIGRYVLLSFIGKGSMGKVYRAWHRMMGRVVALKIVDPKHVSSTRTLGRFRREMQLVGRLEHPNVIRAYDADRIGDTHFIAMEYAGGQTLQELLQARGSLTPVDAIYLAAQAADGLGHAHSQGVLHRDIKPSNLLLTVDGKIKILDFGLGTLLAKEELPAALTAAGITVGTPDYISPEQARMVKIDGRSDLYSLGCTMYHLISGQLPFQGESSMDCLVGRIMGQAPPLAQIVPGLHPRVAQVVEKLMATDPDDRYQTAGEAAAALRGLLKAKSSAPARTGPAESATPPQPGPIPAREAIPATPAPSPPDPIRGGPVLPRSSLGAVRSRWAGLGSKPRRIIAASAIAIAPLLVLAYLIRWASTETPTGGIPETDRGSAPAPSPAPAPSVVLPGPPTPATVPPSAIASRSTASVKEAPPSPPTGAVPPRLSIESPKDGASVGMREVLQGRLESGGWPVVFVQSAVPGQPWWCQAPVESVDRGKFTAKVVFGDEKTPGGTTFRIAVLEARDREEALRHKIGTQEYQLPAGLSRAREIVVKRR